MEKAWPNWEDYPVVKLAQYLAGLTAQQDVWSEAGKALVSLFGADVVAFGERRADGAVIVHHWAFSDQQVGETWSGPVATLGRADASHSDIGLETRKAIAETLESGSLTSRRILTPEPLSVAFLPIPQEDQVTAVMLVGHRTPEPLPQERLNVYLAVAGLVGSIDRDITERKRVEEALRESERILNATGKMGKIGGWEHDLATGKAAWTHALCDIFGIPYDQEPPGVDEHISYYPPRDRKILEQAYDQAVNNGTPFDLELRVYTSEKKLIWCRAQGEPVYKDGKCVAMRGTFQDITDRKQVEEELREHREHLEKLVAERTAELRTLVNAMAGREVRMAELKDVIRKLRAQLEEAGLEPVADDPLMGSGAESRSA
jgi:PAS domain S-box-containing protein